jgi:hypothetical protein
LGQLKSDGNAVDVVAPGATAIVFGELYRIDGWTGFAMRSVGASDTDRKLALEVSPNRIWYVTMPAGVAAARGDMLNWSAGAGFKKATTDLVVTGGGVGPAAKVEEAKDASNVVAVRAIQTLPV